MTNDNKLHSSAKNDTPNVPTPPPKATANVKAIAKSNGVKNSTNNETEQNSKADAKSTISTEKSAQSPVETKSTQQQKSSDDKQNNQQKSDRIRIRLLPIWLRILIVFVLLIVAVTGGIMVGYSMIGDGNASDALKWETWQHILDIIRGVE